MHPLTHHSELTKIVDILVNILLVFVIFDTPIYPLIDLLIYPFIYLPLYLTFHQFSSIHSYINVICSWYIFFLKGIIVHTLLLTFFHLIYFLFLPMLLYFLLLQIFKLCIISTVCRYTMAYLTNVSYWAFRLLTVF